MNLNHLSEEQKAAIQTFLDWYKSDKRSKFITLGGYAGTGKTTLIASFRQVLKKEFPKLRVSFCAFTGKAALVLKNNLRLHETIYSSDDIGTIHSLIYSPVVNSNKEIVGWERKDKLATDLIIVDEASMINQSIWTDLLSFNVPIIAIGDHGQLPPIGGNFSLLKDAELKLEKIHRQAEDNPIIKLSLIAREEGEIEFKEYSSTVKKVSRMDEDSREKIANKLQSYNDDMLVLCGYNFTRVKLNKYIRDGLEFYGEHPQTGDRVICLRNNHDKGIFNGMLGKISSIEDVVDKDDWYFAKIGMEDDTDYKGMIYSPQFNSTEPVNFTEERKKVEEGDLFDFGYALTVHKAQGSQAKSVVLFEERFSKMTDEDWRRWLYTGITRAQEELLIVG